MPPATPSPAHHFRVQLLGPFTLFRDCTQLDTPTWQQRARSLFALLATAPGHERQRDDLLDALWPEATPESASGNLRFTLYLLRRHLGPGDAQTILSRRQVIALNPACSWEIDLDRFRELAHSDDQAMLEEAAALYRGEPLIEYRYEDWAQPLRTSFEEAWRSICQRLAAIAWEFAAPQQAIFWLERFLLTDPLDEETLQQLLRYLNAAGRRAEVHRRYREFETRIWQELGVAPLPETASLVYEPDNSGLQALPQMLGVPATSKSHFVPVVPTYPLPTTERLVGRDMEVFQVLDLLASPERRKSTAVALAAEAGMGKTRFLAELSREGRKKGALTLAGSAYEEEGRLPYGPIHDALLDFLRAQPRHVVLDHFGDLLPDLTKLIPELRLSTQAKPTEMEDQADQRQRLYSAVAETIGRVATEAPVLLLLDDLQWADDATLQLLHFLLRQPALGNLVVVAAYREEEMEAEPVHARIAREGGLYFRLGPLAEPELALLLEGYLGGPCTSILIQVLCRRGSGNPFFTLQMLQLLREEGRLDRSEDGWRLVGTDIDVPRAVRETVVRRLRSLGPDERELLALGAVLGREFSYASIDAIWRGEERDLFNALETAVVARALQETERGYAFRHPLLWEVAYQRVPIPRRAVLHERTALALERLYANQVEERAADLAHHFLAAGQVHLERAFHYSILAGDQTEQVFAHREAERHYRTAANLAEQLDDSQRRADALVKLGGALKATDQLDEAIRVLDAAVRLYELLGNREREAETAAQMGVAYWLAHLRSQVAVRSEIEAGLARLRMIARRLEGDNAAEPSQGLAKLHGALPRLLGALGLYREELEAADRAVEVGRAIGHSGVEAAGHLRRGFALRSLGREDEALSALYQAARQAEANDDLFTLVAACSQTAGIHCVRGDLRSAFHYDDLAFRAAERRGGLEQMVSGGGFEVAADSATAIGDWSRLVEYCERALALYRSLRTGQDYARPMRWLAEVSLYRGDWEDMDLYLMQATAVAQRAGDEQTIQDIGILRSERDLLEGHPMRVLQRPFQFVEYPHSGVSSMSATKLLAWTHAELRHEPEARALAQKVMATAAATKSAPRMAHATYIHGLVLSRLERFEEAEQTLEKAVSLARPMPFPYIEARALHELSRTLARRGDVELAHQRLHQALDIFRRLGARPYIKSTELELQRLSY